MGEFQEQRDGNRERRKATGLNRLTARKVASITRKGRHADGGGLYLQVDGKGAKQWVFLFQRNGRRREMGLGGVSAITLAKARELAAACRADLAAGRDPLQLRREVKEAEQAEHEAAARVEDSRFGAVAEAMLKAKESGWRNAKHRQQWRNTLATYAAPLWDMPVADIKTEHVLECLEPI